MLLALDENIRINIEVDIKYRVLRQGSMQCHFSGGKTPNWPASMVRVSTGSGLLSSA
jgi:hypothetical protein